MQLCPSGDGPFFRISELQVYNVKFWAVSYLRYLISKNGPSPEGQSCILYCKIYNIILIKNMELKYYYNS